MLLHRVLVNLKRFNFNQNTLSKEGNAWRRGHGYLACWERRPYNTVLVSAGNGKVFDLDPDVIFNPSVTSIGGWWIFGTY
jgi:hypothetical protein